ncbi:hypothetical protein A3A84_01490 [Candidatus Collierbacteria bacterium RIFCSPLOWO2_01_FULL_50_23]|uniref:Uncharacterized protein n=2 Tax=Candidatus Collieribacteriota TaxID=1752725 RepID=A0A1F5EVQ1_9BACT|nr:MAG: hypothetical protein A3D09_02565 [Candidatus Collierbacteria bacterium RIFCSPHIGHO2_02_FULL_49_10]OGD71969.1 MAG: hypothetical protein A2703_00450 [Candidatus Collierbacteria bacterium RIFCSPHIGHO2_01_FULL_50_25]OGD74888.1 MAG: hypothetical protein A3A84_01490 [Candidatus Collierbacteria bacterium RIFCSPLOWO2_01_FULL_50_23]
MRKGIKRSPQISFIPLAIIVGLLLVFAGKTVAATMKDNRVLGKVIYLAKGEDGGGDDNGSSGKGSSGNSESSGSSNSGSSDGSNSGSGPSSSGSSTRQATPSQRPERIEPTEAPETEVETENEVEDEAESEAENEEATPSSRIETKPEETRTEVRLSETERIRTRTKDGRTRIDITSGGIKTRLEIRDDRVVVKAEQEDGTEVELADDTLLKIEERLDKSNIKIATASADSFLLQRGNTGAITQFPLSIDLATNTLSVNTPAGTRNVAVLPDQAVQNLIAANIVNRLGGSAVVDQFQAGNLSSIAQLITLGQQNNIPVYEINGISDQKLLGFIPVAISRNVTISAETGQVLATQGPFFSRILDVLSF